MSNSNSPISTADRETLCTELLSTARLAGEKIMEIYATDFSVIEKADQSPVTEADARAEALILEHLAQLAPGIPVVAEEAQAAGAEVTPGDCFFLVDPLDGTKEFVNRRDEFTVNIALVEKGVPTLGVVFAPAIGRLFYSPGNGTAYETGKTGDAEQIFARKPPSSGMKAIASRSHRDAATEAYLQKLGITDFISAGSSLKFCLLAAGEADIYPRFGPTCEWDTGAGHAVLLGAGGHLTKLDTTPFPYAKTEVKFLNPGFLAWGAGPTVPAAAQ